MLTSELIKPRLRFSGSTLSVEMVNEQDPFLQQTAQDLMTLLQRHVGETQEAWEETQASYEGTRVDYIIVRGLAKVLTDAATFTPLETPLPPVTLRERVFAHGPVFRSPDMFHPQTRQEVLQEVTSELTLCAEQIEALLFADRPASYRLTDLRASCPLQSGINTWCSLLGLAYHH